MAAMNKKPSAAGLKKAADKAKTKSTPQGGMTGKPKTTGGKKVFSGTGSTTKPAKMPDLKKPSGISGSTTKKAPAKPGPSIASSIAKRVGTVAREGRDLVTAVSSTAKAGASAVRTRDAFALKKNLQNIPKQVKEVGAAAVKGKIGTPALQTNTGKESHRKTGATVTQNPRSRKNYKG
jgi:hypothetical protein